MKGRRLKSHSAARRFRPLRCEALESRHLLAPLLYAHDQGNQLFTVDAADGRVPTTSIIPITGVNANVTDIAFHPNGRLFGISGVNTTDLYEINPDTAVATLIGTTGFFLNALGFHPNGTLYAADRPANPSGPNNWTKLYTLNLTNGAATVVANGTLTNHVSQGDLAFDDAGILYLTKDFDPANEGVNDPAFDQLLQVTFESTGSVSRVEIVGNNIGFPEVNGLAFANGILYGVSGLANDPEKSEQVFQISTRTGAGVESTKEFFGASPINGVFGASFRPLAQTTLSIAPISANKAEGNAGTAPPTPFTFTVTRSGDTNGTTTVDYALFLQGAPEATASDFSPPVTGTLTFIPGDLTELITINVIGDLDLEPAEDFVVTLTNARTQLPSGEVISTSFLNQLANGTIQNDDSTTPIPPTPVTPEIEVLGLGQNINDGDPSPSPLDGTDFGVVAQNAPPVSRTFTVRNTGGAVLTLSGLNVVPADFVVTEGLSAIIAPGASDTFTVQMTTGAAGPKAGQITFANNDTSENPFNFIIRGAVTVTPPVPIGPQEIEVQALGPISDGAATPSATNGTDFGSVTQNAAPVSRTFTVRNTGGVALTTSGLSVPAGFVVTEGLSASIAPGASDTFTVQLTTAALGTKSGEISFTNNDTDENPFNFNITGTVNEPVFSLVQVQGLGQNIVDGDLTPSLADGTDFGTVAQNTLARRTFTVRNTGAAILTLSGLSVSPGFLVTEGLSPSLAPGASDTFTVQMNTGATGIRSGQVSFIINNTTDNPFNFTVSGTVTPTTLPSVRLSVSRPTLPEAGGTAQVTATLSTILNQPVTVNLGFGGSLATFNVDYIASTTLLTIPAGRQSASMVLTARQDSLVEGPESILVEVLSVSGGIGIQGGSQIVAATIIDDDTTPGPPGPNPPPPPTSSVILSISTDALAEEGGRAVVTATRSTASSGALRVNLGFTGTATFNTDYFPSSTSITIPAGSQAASVLLNTRQDFLVEGPETVVIQVLSVIGGTGAGQQVTATISDDDFAGSPGSVTIDTAMVRPWFNRVRPLDVNNSGDVAPLDALAVINYLNAGLPTAVPLTAAVGGLGYLDTDANNEVSPLDALLIINALNAGLPLEGDASQGEGEPGGEGESQWLELVAADAAEATAKRRKAGSA